MEKKRILTVKFTYDFSEENSEKWSKTNQLAAEIRNSLFRNSPCCHEAFHNTTLENVKRSETSQLAAEISNQLTLLGMGMLDWISVSLKTSV
jgi:hypothetical protein